MSFNKQRSIASVQTLPHIRGSLIGITLLSISLASFAGQAEARPSRRDRMSPHARSVAKNVLLERNGKARRKIAELEHQMARLTRKLGQAEQHAAVQERAARIAKSAANQAEQRAADAEARLHSAQWTLRRARSEMFQAKVDARKVNDLEDELQRSRVRAENREHRISVLEVALKQARATLHTARTTVRGLEQKVSYLQGKLRSYLSYRDLKAKKNKHERKAYAHAEISL